MKIVAIAMILLLSGCGHRADVEDQVRAVLKDPDSAKFGTISMDDSGKVACGLVNSKNSFGGYVGDQSFMVYQGNVRFQVEGEPSLALTSCCYAALGRAQGREATDDLSRSLEADCRKLTPPVVLDPVHQQ